MLGAFLLSAFTRLGHECQDCSSPCVEMLLCIDSTSVYTLFLKRFEGMESEPMLTPREKSPLPGEGRPREAAFVCLLVGCLTSQQQASVSQGRICSDNFTCCLTEMELADQTFYLTPSQYTDTGPTSPSADPITPAAWQGSHWSANF